MEAEGGQELPNSFPNCERIPPHSHAGQQETGRVEKEVLLSSQYIANHKNIQCTRQCHPLIEKKIKLGIVNVFQMISDLVMLQKTGLSDSNLLSIQNEGEKNASYSTAVWENPGGAAFMTTLMRRNKPISRAGVKPNKPEGYQFRRRVLK